MKILLKTLSVPFIILFAALLTEVGIYFRILNKNKPLSPADAVVIFNGASIRNKEGYRIVNEGLAPLLIVSPANIDTQKKYDNIYGRTRTWRHLTEDRADTTFQNALLTGRLIREHQLKRVILVTDSWHMARSYLLLRLMLTGKDVDIIPYGTGIESYIGPPFKWSTLQKKRFYNELVEFWGSACEMGFYFAHGKLPEKSLKEKVWVKKLRDLILLDVP